MRVIDKRIRQHKQVFARHEFYARSHEIRFDSGLHHPRGFVGRRLMIGPEFRNPWDAGDDFAKLRAGAVIRNAR